MSTPEQNLLSKLYESQDEMERYISAISVDDITDVKRDLHYTTILKVLSAKKSLDDLISKLEIIICDKQELM